METKFTPVIGRKTVKFKQKSNGRICVNRAPKKDKSQTSKNKKVKFKKQRKES